MTNARDPEAGFTLIETLVALAVLAISAVALLATTQAHVARIAGLEARAAAMWVAENHLAEIGLGLAPGPTPPAMLGIPFEVEVQATPTTDADIGQLILTATNPQDGRTYARLTGFVLSEDIGATP